MSLSGLDKIKNAYKTLEFRNRTDVSQIIVLNGDSVQVGPSGLVKIPSSLLIQLPSFSTFEPINPKFVVYVDAGLIGSPVTKEAPEVKPSGTTSSSNMGSNGGAKKANSEDDSK